MVFTPKGCKKSIPVMTFLHKISVKTLRELIIFLLKFKQRLLNTMPKGEPWGDEPEVGTPFP